MRHEEGAALLGNVLEAVHAAPFPVYGPVGHPLDLALSNQGVGISHFGNFMSASLIFTTPRYSYPYPWLCYSPKSKNFELISVDGAVQRSEKEHMVFDLEEPSEGQVFNDQTEWLFQEHHFSEEERKQAGSPITWEGTITLAHTAFSGKMLYWRRPLHVSTFLLKSEETILTGKTCGPSDEELMQLLEGLQVLNQQDDVLKRYQYEIENPGL